MGARVMFREWWRSRQEIRFLGFFGALYLLFHFLFKGSGPVGAVNRAIQELTVAQTAAAERLLRILGEPVIRTGDVLSGTGFSCSINEGCNGMAAVNLVLAGTLAFPASPGLKVSGMLLLLPAVFAVNILRIAGLYWTGVHRPDWFVLMHVYVGQIVVIAATAVLWLIWLSWSSRRPAASS